MTDEEMPSSTPTRASRGLRLLALLVLYSAALAVRLPGLSDPWERGHRGLLGGGYFASITTNFAKHGVAELRAYPTFALGDGMEPEVYWHHPPVFGLALYGFTQVAGRSEASFRVFSLICTMLFLVLLFEWLRRQYDFATAWFATACAAVVPMCVSYGNFVSYEPALLLAGTAGVAAFVSWLKSGGRFALLGTLLCTALAASLDWPGYFYWAAYAVVCLCLAPRGRRFLPALSFLGLGLVSFLGFSLHVAAARSALGQGDLLDFWRTFWEFALELRSKNAGIPWSQWWPHQFESFAYWFRAPGWSEAPWSPFALPAPGWLLLAALGLPVALLSRRPGKPRLAALFLLFFPAFLNVVGFWNNSYGHEFHAYYFVPVVALLAGRTLALLASRGGGARIGLVLALVLVGLEASDCVVTIRYERAHLRTDLYRDQGELIAAHTGPRAFVLCSKTAWPSQFYADRAMTIDAVLRPADLKAAAQFADWMKLDFDELFYCVGRRHLESAAALIALADGPPVAESSEHVLYRLPRALIDRLRAHSAD